MRYLSNNYEYETNGCQVTVKSNQGTIVLTFGVGVYLTNHSGMDIVNLMSMLAFVKSREDDIRESIGESKA